MDFTRSTALRTRAHRLIPGGCHTYAKGDDQYPELAPGFIARGLGSHVWDADGNEFIEYGMGLRSVALGHAYPPVVEAVRESLALGTNFTRPAPIEVECAEALLGLIDGAEMVKFTKDGSSATTAALKLARAVTSREAIAVCRQQPFFSYDDWFISTTTMDAGIPSGVLAQAPYFDYNDLASLRALFEARTGRDKPAAVILEPARMEEPAPGFLEGLAALCRAEGALLIFDETITGFRWHLQGAQKLYGVVPDLSIFGKALANGFSLSALAGRRDVMRLGSRERPQDAVFLLSTTHGAETPALAAAIATMRVYRSEPVVEHLHRQGERLARGVRQAIARHGLEAQVEVAGRACNLQHVTRGPDGRPSQAFRSLFLQELIRRGVIAPSLVVSYSHGDAEVDHTIEAVDSALLVYRRALSDGVERHLIGPPSRPVLDRR